MTETSRARPDTVGQTPWSSRLTLPLRAFQRTESASAGVLAAAIVVALVWANLGPGYERPVDAPSCRCGSATWRSSRTCGSGSTAG